MIYRLKIGVVRETFQLKSLISNPMIDVTTLTIEKAAKHLKAGDFTAVELAEACLKKIEESDKEINSFLEVYDDVLAQAAEADKKIAGSASPLTGIPLAVKDNILIEGRRASAASKILEGFVAPYDATVIARLKTRSPVFVGRTNMDEFAMGSSTENSAFGPTRNPYDPTRVPGGSSGGSAAAVVMGGALAALGSDTGGSIRQPASLCGLVGFKGSYGAVSRYGLVAMGSSLDQIGPLARTVSDAELFFNAIAGADCLDSTSVSLPPAREGGLRVGVPSDFLEKGIDQDVLRNFKESLERLKDCGCETRELKFAALHYALPVYYIIMPAEASTNLSRFDGVKYGRREEGGDFFDDYRATRRHFGSEVRRRIMLGTYVLSSGYYDAYYRLAVALRSLLRREFESAFGLVDFIATPTSPTPAWKIGEKAGNSLSMYLSDIFTVTANIVGLPAISIPSGLVRREGVDLPVSIQLMAPYKADPALFSLGKRFEKTNRT